MIHDEKKEPVQQPADVDEFDSDGYSSAEILNALKNEGRLRWLSYMAMMMANLLLGAFHRQPT